MIKSTYKVGRKGERRNIATHRPQQQETPTEQTVGNPIEMSPLDYQSLAEPISPNLDGELQEKDPLRMGF